METQLILITFGAGLTLVTSLVITFITYFLSVKQYRSATIYAEQVRCYSDLLPILSSPLEQSMSTEELEAVFNKAILVSNDKKLSRMLKNMLVGIKNYRLKSPTPLERNVTSPNFFRKLLNKWRDFWRIQIILTEDEIKGLNIIKRYFYLYRIWRSNSRSNGGLLKFIGKTQTAEISLAPLFSKSLRIEGEWIIEIIQKKMNIS